MTAEDLPCCKNVGATGFTSCGKPAARAWFSFDQECVVAFCADHAGSYEGHAYAAELTLHLARWIEKKRTGAFLCPECREGVTFAPTRVQNEAGAWITKDFERCIQAEAV